MLDPRSNCIINACPSFLLRYWQAHFICIVIGRSLIASRFAIFFQACSVLFHIHKSYCVSIGRINELYCVFIGRIIFSLSWVVAVVVSWDAFLLKRRVFREVIVIEASCLERKYYH